MDQTPGESRSNTLFIPASYNHFYADTDLEDSSLDCITPERSGACSFLKSDEDSRAAGISKDRVQLAAHKRWDPGEGFDDAGLDFPDVPVVTKSAVGIPVVPVVTEDGMVPFVCVATVVFALVGAEELTARLAKKTFKALNSCPRPIFPSYSLCVQCIPQAVLLAPPEHCSEAPSAELWRYFRIISVVKCATYII